MRLLGKMRDREFAKLPGLHFGTVEHERHRRSIPPYRLRRPDIEWTDEMIALLGTDSDPNVAAQLGVSKYSVRYKRTVLGIPPFTEPSRKGPSDGEIFWVQGRRAKLGALLSTGLSRAR